MKADVALMVATGGFMVMTAMAIDTVPLCCQERLRDERIKRDRLMWMGDMYPETMAILNVFGGASTLKDSIDLR